MAQKPQLSLGVDLGGTSVRVGLYGNTFELLDSRSRVTRVSAGPQVCVDEVATDIDSLLSENGYEAADVLGVGVGSPGPINLRTGVLGTLPNLPGWGDFPLRDAVAKATGLPTILESDANAAAIAEWKLGAGQESGLNSMAMITLGTGVGSGLILAGQVWHGMFGMGGEVGHATVEPGGLLCSCGTRGCLEMYASASGLLRLATAIAASAETTRALQQLMARPEGATPQCIAELAQQKNDPAAKLAFERLGYYLGIGIANLINTLDLPMIVVGGGVASAWALFASALFRAVREYSVIYRLVAPSQLLTMETNRTFIRPALLGPSAGLMGAGLLPRLASSESGDAILNYEVAR